MKNIRKFLAILMTLALCLTLLGGAFAEEAAEAPSGSQVLRYGTDTWPAGYDPHTISAIAATRVFNQVYETLIGFNRDMTYRGILAESWETPDDVTYIFHLRQGVKFHNGREMTADDVVYSFQRILGQTDAGDIGALGSSDSYYGGIATIEALDDYTVQIVLEAPNAAFMSNLTSTYSAIVCREVVEANDGSLSAVDTMCGTGPFKYSESVVDNHITLVKNEDYWMEGAPILDGITYYLLADESARLAALRTGDIDLCSLSAMNLADVEGDENIQVISYQSNNYTYLGFNLSNEALQDVRVRQAMSMAVDRNMIIDYVHNGEAAVSTFVAPNLGHWVWDAVNESPLYTYDVEAARALMEEAGYGEDNRLSLTMAAGLLDTIRDTAVVLQQQLKEIYIDVEITNLESGEYVDIWGIMDTPEAGFDMMCGQNGSGTDPNRAVSFFFSTTGGANVWGYSNERVDELCQLAVSTTDEAEREAYYMEAQQIIIEESPNLFFASPMEYLFASSALRGYEPYAADASIFTEAYFVR